MFNSTTIYIMIFCFLSCVASDSYYELQIKESIIKLYQSKEIQNYKVQEPIRSYEKWMTNYAKISTEYINPSIEKIREYNHNKK